MSFIKRVRKVIHLSVLPGRDWHDYVANQLRFSETQTELANLPNFAAKFDKLG